MWSKDKLIVQQRDSKHRSTFVWFPDFWQICLLQFSAVNNDIYNKGWGINCIPMGESEP